MITRRNILKGAAAGVVASAAAATLIRLQEEPALNVLEATTAYGGFGLAQVKREGGFYYPDPADDPANRAWYEEHAPHLLDNNPPLIHHAPQS